VLAATIHRHPRTPRHTPLRALPHQCVPTSPSDTTILIPRHDEPKAHDQYTSCILGLFSSVRYWTRLVTVIDEHICPRCDEPFYVSSKARRGRPQRWCSHACRRAAYEERRAAKKGAIAIEYIEKPAPEISLDQHVAAVLDSPAACRNVLRQLRSRADDGMLDEAKWSSVSDELEHLRTSPGRRSDGWFSSR